MLSIVWILAIGWLVVAVVNAWQMRSIEREWEAVLREHGDARGERHPVQAEIAK